MEHVEEGIYLNHTRTASRAVVNKMGKKIWIEVWWILACHSDMPRAIKYRRMTQISFGAVAANYSKAKERHTLVAVASVYNPEIRNTARRCEDSFAMQDCLDTGASKVAQS